MENKTLGELITNTEKERGVIYVEILPALAQVELKPGQDVGAFGTLLSPIGIVDPFLKDNVYPDQQTVLDFTIS